MVMVTLALVMAVIVTNLYAKKDSCVRPPHFIVTLAKRFYSDQLLPTDRLHGTGPRNKRDCNGRHSDVISITDGEIDTLNGCTCCCQCHNHSGSFTGAGNNTADLFANISFEICDAEWRLVSKFADRAFFWIFVLISSTVQILLFRQMVPSESALEDLISDD